MLALVTTSTGVAIGLSFFNTQSVFLLADPNYFNIADKKTRNIKLGSHAAAAATWTMILTPFMGQLYEVFGRRAVIAMNFAIMVFFIWLTPYSHTMLPGRSSLEILKFCRVIVTVCSTFLMTSPLTVDYIKSEDQGKGTSVNEIGTTIGAFTGMSLLVNVVETWD
jgi:MFS family permease